MKGQYLERPTVIPSGELYLEGLFHRGAREPGVLILAPLAAAGSPMESPIVAELAWALHRAKRATLRFNPRGLGASQGTRPSEADLLADARSALQSLQESAADPGSSSAVVGIGSSCSTAMALAHESARVRALVLIAPPSTLAASLGSGAPPTFVALPEADPWSGPRGRQGTLIVEEVTGADANFLRGLPLFGRAVGEFLDRL